MICHLSSIHGAADVRILNKECATLAGAGLPTCYVAADGDSHMSRGVEVRSVPRSEGRLGRMLGTTWRVYLEARKTGARVYHFHDPELIPMGLLLKLQGARVIYDAHEDLPRDILSKDWIPGALRKPVAWLAERIEDAAARRLDAVVAATPAIHERFARQGIRAVNINNYPLRDELLTPDVDWSAKEVSSVCYLGGISDIKGLYEMVEAVGQTKARLLLAGRFASEAQRERAMSMPGWRQVEELGQLDRTQAARMLSRCRAGLAIYRPEPNNVRSQPNKLFEYMSAGLPVIASNFPGWRRIIEDAGCGICVDPGDTGAIAGAIRWCLEHPREACEMGRRGRVAVERTYNWEAEGEKLIALYRDLLG